jgi:hypothetical protein
VNSPPCSPLATVCPDPPPPSRPFRLLHSVKVHTHTHHVSLKPKYVKG